MRHYDVVDEAEIDADERTVFEAILDEYRGASNWWKPHLELKVRGGKGIVQKGSVIDFTTHIRFGRRKFAVRVAEIVEGRSLKVEYIEGDFFGTGEWTFGPSGGKTKVKYRWIGGPNGLLMTLLSLFINIAKYHSEVFQLGFKGLSSYVRQKGRLGSRLT